MATTTSLHRYALSACLLLGVLVLPARGQEAVVAAKMDPGARALMVLPGAGKQYDKRLLSELPYAVRVDEAGVLVADLFVEFVGSVPVAQLEAMQIEPQAVVGTIAAVRAPVEAIEALAMLDQVAFVEASGRSYVMGPGHGADIRAREVLTRTGLEGQGVVLGIVDTGIDFTHPDLRDSTGTRIRYLWDMSDLDHAHAPTGVDPSFTWGREYTAEEIDTAPQTVVQIDGDGGFGHGTHVAGVAAGSGALRDDRRGVAPGTDLIVVKALRNFDSSGDFSDADIVAACDYIFKRAAALDRPAVINLSLGHYSGPLDGTSLYERTLTALVGPGRLIVAAGGNGAAHPMHTGAALEPDREYVAFFDAESSTQASVNIWYETGAIEWVSVGAYQRVNGELLFLGEADPVFAGQSRGLGLPIPLSFDGAVRGHLTVDALTTQDQRNGDGVIRIALSDGGAGQVDLKQVVWTVRLRGGGSGESDLWVQKGSFLQDPPADAGFVSLPGDSRRTVASPATARGLIAVGSHVDQTALTNIFGQEQIVRNPGPQPGDPDVTPDVGGLSYFSGVGPTRDGRNGIALTAPGEIVASLLSSHLTPGVGFDSEWVLEGGYYYGLMGTSIAAAHVSGVLALMLEANPQLDAGMALRILEETSRADLQTGPTPNPAFGAGKLDADAAVERAQELAAGSAVAAIDITEIDLGIPQNWVALQPMTIENQGTTDLQFRISGADPVQETPSKQASLSAFATPDVSNRETPAFEGSSAGKMAGPAATAVEASDNVETASFDASTSNAIVYDDGNHRADRFWGFGNGTTDLFWGNLFRLNDAGFSLERIHFFMRTEAVESNTVWVAVYNRSTQQRVLAEFVNLDLAPDGAWFEVLLEQPIAFEKNHSFFIELAASGAIHFPAGVDARAITQGTSNYAAKGQIYKNLVNETSSGLEHGAFLIRALGTSSQEVNLPPTASAVVSALEASELEVITFDASHSVDPEGALVSYRWDFGDGATSDEIMATHAYAAPGTYTATLHVEDDAGATAQASGAIQILPFETLQQPRLVVTPAEGTIPPGGAQRIEVTFNTAQLAEGVYSGMLDLSTTGGYYSIPMRFEVDNVYVANETETGLPDRLMLDPSFPNPFSHTTAIRYALPDARAVTVEVFDAMGRRVRQLEAGSQSAGSYEVRWDATDDTGVPVASGVYFYRLETTGAGGQVEARAGKVILIR
ncbi:MAG: S8 family serine peptidase [Rhodothermales bacterium]